MEDQAGNAEVQDLSAHSEDKRNAHGRIEETYREGKQGFLRRAKRAAGSLVDAEDIVQDAFVAALGNVDTFVRLTDPTSWIYSTIRNRMIDLWRRERTRKAAGQVDVAEETLQEIVSAIGFDPQDEFVQDELSDALADAIEALPEKQKAVIVAQVFEGSTFREISERTGIPIETLAARKRSAVRALAKALHDWITED